MISAQFDRIWPPIVVASLEGQIDLVRHLIDSGEDINARHELTGEDALSMAAIYDRIEIVEALLKAGADPNRILEQSNILFEPSVAITPFFRAVQSAPLRVVTYLARCGGVLTSKQVESLIRHSPKRISAIEHVISIALSSDLLACENCLSAEQSQALPV